MYTNPEEFIIAQAQPIPQRPIFKLKFSPENAFSLLPRRRGSLRHKDQAALQRQLQCPSISLCVHTWAMVMDFQQFYCVWTLLFFLQCHISISLLCFYCVCYISDRFSVYLLYFGGVDHMWQMFVYICLSFLTPYFLFVGFPYMFWGVLQLLLCIF